VCEHGRRTRQVASGESVELSPPAAAMVHCDAQHVGAHVGAKHDAVPVRATQDVAPATRRAVIRRDHGHCQVPGCDHFHFVDRLGTSLERGQARSEQPGDAVRRPPPSSSRRDAPSERQRRDRLSRPLRRRHGVRRSSIGERCDRRSGPRARTETLPRSSSPRNEPTCSFRRSRKGIRQPKSSATLERTGGHGERLAFGAGGTQDEGMTSRYVLWKR
jgi:hypothetical protein